MPFAADTKVRIMMALELPIVVPAYVQTVERSLLDAEVYGGETVVTLIEGYLTQFEAAQTSLNGEAANVGLIQADVLRWESGKKTQGYLNEMARLRSLIAKVLMLEGLSKSSPNRISISRG